MAVIGIVAVVAMFLGFLAIQPSPPQPIVSHGYSDHVKTIPASVPPMPDKNPKGAF